MADEWYRRKSWTKADEDEFFVRLGRARKDGRAQYLKIQALELIYTRNPKLLTVAESLLNKLLTDYPDDRIQRSQTFNSLGTIYRSRGDYEKALSYFKKGVDFELEFPNVISGVHLSYAELVVETERTECYDEVEELLLADMKGSGLLFPANAYTIASVLAVISAHKGDEDSARFYADLAEKNASAKTNTLWNPRKKHLGLVEKRKGWLDGLVKKSINLVKR